MINFKSILVPIDGSASSQRVVAHAVYMAELCQASIGLLHVVNLPKIMPDFSHINTGGYIPNSLLDEALSSARILVNESLKLVPSSIKAKAFAEIGSPTEVIISFCNANKYDLIVIGQRGLGTIKQFVFGSVSRYVLSNASCPVMLIK